MLTYDEDENIPTEEECNLLALMEPEAPAQQEE